MLCVCLDAAVSQRALRRACVQGALALWVGASGAQAADTGGVAASAAEVVLPELQVSAHHAAPSAGPVGGSAAASSGAITRQLIERRPTLRPAEVLEFVPGVIVSQHSGDGKANQYYLRGFNLDHGTDFATWVDGMPINMPSHAHGQGYTDLNWLIPELVDRIQYRKGTYAAEDGDFSSAGSARIRLVDTLPQGLASVTVGERAFVRALVAKSQALTTGQLLYAVEGAHNNGPWELAQQHRRFNGVLRYSVNEGSVRQSLTAMTYTARWRATDQVPLRALDAGLVGRYGAIDDTDHGRTARSSLSYQRRQTLADGELQLSAFAIASSLDLYSNFTYFLDDPVNGDQFEQAERRRVVGGQAVRSWAFDGAGQETTNKLGVQVRHDRLSPVGLYSAAGGVRTGTTQESRVRQTSVGVFGENDTRWLPWLRTVAGLRADQVAVAVRASVAGNGGERQAALASPKLSLVLGPWAGTEFFVNGGYGFHSNDARGMTAAVSPRTGAAVDRVPGLVRTRGAELGARTELIPGLQGAVALWQLDLASELVFVGDAGDTAASGASRRRGVELNLHHATPAGVLFDVDVALSQARFRQDQGDAPHQGRDVPGAVGTVVSLGATLAERGPWFGQFQLRYFGSRPLIEDQSVRSPGTTLASVRAGYRINLAVKVSLDVFNLFNRQVSDIDYFYTSRLPGEGAEGVADRHLHPAEPRTVRLTLSSSF